MPDPYQTSTRNFGPSKPRQPVYNKTREALADYFAEPTSGKADLVRVAFWLEAPTSARGKHPNPSVTEIRAIVGA